MQKQWEGKRKERVGKKDSVAYAKIMYLAVQTIYNMPEVQTVLHSVCTGHMVVVLYATVRQSVLLMP